MGIKELSLQARRGDDLAESGPIAAASRIGAVAEAVFRGCGLRRQKSRPAGEQRHGTQDPAWARK